MNTAYQLAFRLNDLMSPALRRVQQVYERTVGAMERGSSRIQSGFAKAGQSVEQLRRKLGFGKEAQSVDQLNKKLDELTRRRNISINSSEIRRLNSEITATEGKLKRLQGMGSGAAGGGLMGMVGASGLGSMVVGAGLLAGAGAFFGQGIGREQTQIAYEQFTRDKQVAQQLIAEQNRFADVTPFTNEEVMGAGRNLLSYGFNAKDIIKQERMVGDVAAGVQANFGELAGIYGKLKSKGFADTGDLWQFADRGIPILDALSKSLGKSKEEILKMAETRQIKFTDIEKAFSDMTSKGGQFEGMLEKMSQTTGGKLSTFVGTVQNKIGQLAEALNPVIGLVLDMGSGLLTGLDPVFAALMNLFKAFEPLFNAIRTLLGYLGLGGQQAGLLSLILTGLAGVINLVAWVVNALASAIQFLVDNPILLFLTSAGLIILNLGTIVGWMITLIGWIGTAFNWLIALAEAFWAVNGAMLMNPAVWVVAALAAVVAGIVWLWNNCEGFRHALIKLWEVAKAVFGSLGKAWNALMKGDFAGMAKAFGDGIQQGMKNAATKISADKAARSAGAAPKVPAPPKLAKPAMPTAPGAGGAGGGGGKAGNGVGKAAGLDATTGGQKSTTITINIKSLVERLTITASSAREGIDDMEAQVTDALLRSLNSANSLAT